MDETTELYEGLKRQTLLLTRTVWEIDTDDLSRALEEETMPLSSQAGSGKALLPIQGPGQASNVNPNSQPPKAKKPKGKKKGRRQK